MSKIGDLFVRLGLKKDDYERGLRSASNSTQSFGSKLKNVLGSAVGKFAGLAGAIMLVGKALKDAVKNIATFERANSTLASVLGTSVKNIKELSDSARQLGRTTEFTATNVAELQTALARLGFTKQQILNMQESILKFASAVGTDLASAADFAGSALRAFGLQSEDTAALLDVMAASTSKSALDFSKLATSISVVAPVANAFGLKVNETAAFLGVLANNGFDASSAATALRNILLNLADSGGKLASGIGHAAKTFPEIIEAFKELTARGVKVDEVLGMTDRRSAAAALALIANADAVRQLNNELSSCDGTLNTMYGTMTDNVIGATNNLKSAWEGLTLAFSNSKGVIKDVVQFLADAINSFTSMMDGTYADQKFQKYVDQAKKSFFKDDDYWSASKKIIEKETEIARMRKEGKEYEAQSAEQYLKILKEARRQMFGTPGVSSTPTTTTTTPTTIPTIPTDDKEDAAVKAEKAKAAAILKAAKEAQMSKKELLTAQYEEEKALLEKYGLDTTDLTRKYNSDMLDLVAQHRLDVIKAMRFGEDIEVDFGINAAMDEIDTELEMETDKIVEDFEKIIDACNAFKEAVAEGFTEGCQEMMDQLMGLEDFNPGAVVKSLLTPLADMAVKEGEILIAEGVGVEACKKALESLNGYAAIAAGVALVAIGTAAKAGLSALAKGGATSASTTEGYTGAGAASTQNIETELTIHVEGRLSGSDIVLAGQKTLNNWGR